MQVRHSSYELQSRHTGTSLVSSAVCFSYEQSIVWCFFNVQLQASQEGLKDFLSQMERFQCLGGGGRTCYGENDLQEPETTATTKGTTNPPSQVRQTSKEGEKKQRNRRSGKTARTEQNKFPAAEKSASLSSTSVVSTNEFKGLGSSSVAEIGKKRSHGSTPQGTSL